MEWTIQFAYPWLLLVAALGVPVALWYFSKRSRRPLYTYPLTQNIIDYYSTTGMYRSKVLLALRVCALVLLFVTVMRLQEVNKRSSVHVEGIDMMLVLDVSGSMQVFDDYNDPTRTRVEVAKQEAIRFIQKREHDPIVLVIFARDVVPRCPLTLDKKLLEKVLDDIELGVIDENATMLSKALITAINRLKNVQSKNKIIILLTDGEPSQGDFDPRLAIELAHTYGIKIYTIGIGSEEGGFYVHPLFGVQRAETQFNKRLLSALAKETGGTFFEARRPDDLQKIYATIDSLEKTVIETDIYQRRKDIFKPFVWGALCVSAAELFLKTTVWFGL